MKYSFRLNAVLGLGIVLAMVSSGYASTFKVIYTFGTNGSADGYLPDGTLVRDAAGNLYGTTIAGGTGAYPAGTVFELTPNSDGTWTEETLYTFTGGADGAVPFAGVVFDSKGNLYGTTQQGGISNGTCGGGCGVVFELSPSATGWTHAVLHSFSGGPDGAVPTAPVVLDAAGNVYGTTEGGGVQSQCYSLGCGIAFELVRAHGWKEKVLHTFQNAPKDGAYPAGGVTFDGKGNLVGTTEGGGNWSVDAGSDGTVYKLTPNSDGTWSETELYGFCALSGCADGSGPAAGVVVRNGKIYGTTGNGGGQNGSGTVFELSETASGSGIQVFPLGGANGATPMAPVLLNQGRLFGVASQGGFANNDCLSYGSGDGVVFELAQQNGKPTETVLYAFTGGSDGCIPRGGLTADAAGNIYGTTLEGGSLGLGVVFEVTP